MFFFVSELGNECVQDSDCSGVIANSQCDTSTNPDSCACNDGYRASGTDTCLANSK